MGKKRNKLFILALALMMVMTMIPAGAYAATAEGNLLLNPSFEQFTENEDGYLIPNHWRDPNGTFASREKSELSDEQAAKIDGDYYCWPSITSNYPDGKGADSGQRIYIYQDVDVATYDAGTIFMLSGLIFNYNQAPHDQSILSLQFLDEDGNVLESRSRNKRNPNVSRVYLNLEKPENAVTLRVYCTAQGYVGFDVDGYFDDLSLVAANSGLVDNMILFGDASIKAGKSTTLTAYNGVTTDASAYTWESSYDQYAKVTQQGKVTLTSKFVPAEGVSIYATDKETGFTAEFQFGKGVTNDQDALLSKVTGLKASKKTKNSITLTWKKNVKADGYYVQKYDAKKKQWKNATTIKKNSTVKYTNKSLKSKTSYKYRVVAYKSFGSYKLKINSSTLTVKTK